MGIYDREYYQPSRQGLSVRGPSTVVGWVILINVVAFLANGLLSGETNRITDLLGAHVATLGKPWMWWQFLTYGFAHSPVDFSHILFNMLGLWFLGRDIESTYGRTEFLRLYLALIVVGGLGWALANQLLGTSGMVVGASGAIVGIVILYALHFPRRTLLLFFVLPVPAWLVGVFVVVSDLYGATQGGGETNIAYGVHLSGAAFAFAYYRFGWNLGRLVPGGFSLSQLKPKPKLRVHNPEPDSDLAAEVDRILEKISREGEASLSRRERRTLESASRQYQRRRD